MTKFSTGMQRVLSTSKHLTVQGIISYLDYIYHKYWDTLDYIYHKYWDTLDYIYHKLSCKTSRELLCSICTASIIKIENVIDCSLSF